MANSKTQVAHSDVCRNFAFARAELDGKPFNRPHLADTHIALSESSSGQSLMPIPFYLFSYNRGRFLKNCVDSIITNAPDSPITIVDDGSNDPETVDILNALPERIRILRQKRETVAKLGGLYRNMQLALDDMQDDVTHFIFIQDDTQVVRPLTADDYTYFEDYFSTFPEAAFLNPHFLKGVRKRGIVRSIYADKTFPTYFYNFSENLKDRSVTMYFTDICVGHAPRMKQANFRYQDNESTSAQHARKLFSKMGTMAHPLLMSLPEVPIYRGKQKTLGVTLAEKRLGTDPNAFRQMTPDEVTSMKERDLSILPFAEDFLKCTGRQPKIPFVKESVNAFTALRIIHKIELKFRKLFRL